MSLLRTAQASPSRTRSGKVSSLRAKFENNSIGESKSFKSNSIAYGVENSSVATTTTDPELRQLVHDANRAALHNGGGSATTDGDQSMQSYMRTLSGSSGSSSFSVSKMYNAAKRKMNKHKWVDSSVGIPPLMEVKASGSSSKSSKKVSLGGNLQMDFNFTMPIDRVHVQNGQQTVPDPRDIIAKKHKKEAYAKAEKLLEKLDEQQKFKIARAKKQKLENAKKRTQSPHVVATTARKAKVVKVTQIAEDTSTIDTSRPSTPSTSKIPTDNAFKLNQKQRLLARLDRMGIKTLEVAPVPSRKVPEPPSIQSSVYTSQHSKDPSGRNASSHGSVDPSGFVVSFNADDSTMGSGSSSRSNEENHDPTSPLSVRIPKSTNCSMSKSLDTFQSEVGDSHSSDNSQPFRTKSLPPRSTKRFDGHIARKPHQTLPKEGNEDVDCGYGYNDTVRMSHFGDFGAAEIAMQMLGGGSVIDSNEKHDIHQRRMETITSFEQSVHVITDGTGEDFEAVHVDEAHPFDDEENDGAIYLNEHKQIDVVYQDDDFIYQTRTDNDQEADEDDEINQSVDYSTHSHADLNSEHDKYSVHAEEMLADVMNIAATRLSAPKQTSSSSSYMNIANGMEEFLNLASSHLGGSGAVQAKAEAGQASSSFSFDNMMDFAASQLKTTPRQHAKFSTHADNISVQSNHKSENDSVASAPKSAMSYQGTEDESVQKFIRPKARPPPINTNLPPIPPKTETTPKVAVEQSDCDSECSEWSEGFFVEPEEEVVFIDLETEEPNQEPLRCAQETLSRFQPSTVKSSGQWLTVRTDKAPVTGSSDSNRRDASKWPAGASPSPESPRQTSSPLKAHGSLLAASKRAERPALLPTRSDFKQTIAPPPAEAFNHPIPIQMSPGKALADDLSNSIAPSSMSDSNSVLTKEDVKGVHSSLVTSMIQSPSTVDQFPLNPEMELSTPLQSNEGEHEHCDNEENDDETRNKVGATAHESLLGDDDVYWDTLSSIATESIIRSQKNFEDVTQEMVSEMQVLSPVPESSSDMEGGCICPWNEHVRLPPDHPDYKGPEKNVALADIISQDSGETFDEGIPIEITYLPNAGDINNLPKEPQPSLPGSENVSGLLGNLRSILTESSSSSSSETSLIYSDKRSHDIDENPLDSFAGSVDDVDVSNLQEAIKRGEDQAFVDSPKPGDQGHAYVDGNGDTAVFQLGPPPLPLLSEPKIDDNGTKQSEVKQTGTPSLVAYFNSPIHKGETQQDERTSPQDIFARLSHAFISQDESENDVIETEILSLENDAARTNHLNTIHQLISEDKSELSDHKSENEQDGDNNSETTRALLLALSRSVDRTDRSYAYESTSFVDSMDDPSPGLLDTYLIATSVQDTLPYLSVTAVGGSPKRRKMKGESNSPAFIEKTPNQEIDVTNLQISDSRKKANESKAPRPKSPTKQRPPSPEMKLSPIDLLMEEAEMLLSKGLLHNNKLYVSDKGRSPVKPTVNSVGVLAPSEENGHPTAPTSVSPQKSRRNELVILESVSAEFFPETDAGFSYSEEQLSAPLQALRSQSVSPQKKRHGISKVQHNASSLTCPPATDIMSNEVVHARKNPTQRVMTGAVVVTEDRTTNSSDPSGHVVRVRSPEKARFPSPERAPKGPSPEKVRFPSPEKVVGGKGLDKVRHASPGLSSTAPEKWKSVSPQKRPPSPEAARRPLPERENKHSHTSASIHDHSATNIRSRRHLVVDTADLTPAYSFDTDENGRKTLGRSPRLQSVLARMELRKQERAARQKSSTNSPTMEETLEEYDILLDQLVRQNTTLKRGGKASDTSLGSNSDAIRKQIDTLRQKKAKAAKVLNSVPLTRSRGKVPPSPESRQDERPFSPRKQSFIPEPRSTPVSVARGGSRLSSAVKARAVLKYRPENGHSKPGSESPPARPGIVPLSSSIRSRSVPTRRQLAQENDTLNAEMRRIMSYSEQVKEVFKPAKVHEEKRSLSSIARYNKFDDHHKGDDHRSSYEAVRPNLTDDVPADDKYQRLHHQVFRPPVISESHVLRSTSPPWHSSKKTTPKSIASKREDVKKTLSPVSTTPPSSTPYMDKLMRERGIRTSFDMKSDKRNPSPSQRFSPYGNGDYGGHRRDEREANKDRHYSPLRRQMEIRESDDTKPVSSPEKRRLLGNNISKQTDQLKRDLEVARLNSQRIRSSQATLSSELEAFKRKLSQHARNKQGERDIIGACQSELGGFQQRLQATRRGIGARNDSFVSEMTLDTAWEDFSEIRGAMLTNLKLMHDAQERLIRERFRVHEDCDDDSARLREIQDLMHTIQKQEKYDSEMVRIALEAADRLG